MTVQAKNMLQRYIFQFPSVRDSADCVSSGRPEEVGHAPNCSMVEVINQSGACIFLQVDLEGIVARGIKGRTIRKVMGGGGGERNFQLAQIFFFAHCLYRNFFFQVKPIARIFFSDKYCFFLSEISIHYLICTQ